MLDSSRRLEQSVAELFFPPQPVGCGEIFGLPEVPLARLDYLA
jgi:hypothetical protein